MIASVSFEKSTYNVLPHRFEAGTPNIAGAVGLGAALTYMENLDRSAAFAYEEELLQYATRIIGALPGVRLIGTASQKAGVLGFLIEGIHPHDVGTILDHEGIAVRAGHHCAQPVMEYFGIAATVRASLAFYNTHEEIDRLAKGISKTQEIFG